MMKSREISFTDEEVEYLEQNRLARIATSSRDNQPHVVPVTYEFDGNYFYFGGWKLDKSLKFRNIQNNGRVALVIDDLVTIKPWRPRGVEVRGTAEVQENNDGQYIRITPTHKVSWGLIVRR